ncbi:MAG: nucleoside monophosphate kinase [Acidobacteriaceae bacterium]|nr:nucleoside monophosphate kinase [Acidobacteriaceae bacterium]
MKRPEWSYLEPKAIILVGPPGSGKGTQAARVSPVLGIPTVSTGEMLRRECQSGSALGHAVKAILASGQLVSDDLMNQVVASRLRESDCRNGFILDGYPRTVAQARFLENLLVELNVPGRVVFHFDISNKDVVSRLTRRLQCAKCGRIFSMSATAGDREMLCDRDGSTLVHRPDDDANCIPERLRLYEKNANPLLRFYRQRGCHRIRANRSPEEVAREILAVVSSESTTPRVVFSRPRAKAAGQPSYSV